MNVLNETDNGWIDCEPGEPVMIDWIYRKTQDGRWQRKQDDGSFKPTQINDDENDPATWDADDWSAHIRRGDH